MSRIWNPARFARELRQEIATNAERSAAASPGIADTSAQADGMRARAAADRSQLAPQPDVAPTPPVGPRPSPRPRLTGTPGPLMTSMLPVVGQLPAARPAAAPTVEEVGGVPALLQLTAPIDRLAEASLVDDPGPEPEPRHLAGCDGYPACEGCPTCPRCRRLVEGLAVDQVCAVCEHEVGVRPRCCPGWPICSHETARDGKLVERARQLGDEISAAHPAVAAVAMVLGKHDLSQDTGEDDGGPYPTTCRCGWDGPDEHYDQHVAEQLAIAGVLRAPLGPREPNRITWDEIVDLARLSRLAEDATGGDPYEEPRPADLAWAQHVMRTGRVYLIPAPPQEPSR